LHRSQMHDRGRPPSGRSNAKLGTAADVGIKRTRSITELVVVLVVVLVLLAGWLLTLAKQEHTRRSGFET